MDPTSEVRPSTPEGVVDAVVDLLARRPGVTRLAVDGAPAAGPHDLAARVVRALATTRGAVHVRADRFWLPAGQRFEWGREDPDAYLDTWLDVDALRREVLEPAVGEGVVLPALRDPDSDRSVRSQRVALRPTSVVVVSGSVLLGAGLPFDVAVHLRLSPAALARRTGRAEAWTLPAFARYDAERSPGSSADLVVRCDDPRRPALVAGAGGGR